MRIEVDKVTTESLMKRACRMTIRGESNVSLEKMYRCEHSPIRTQLFWIEMYDIPTFVSVHLVRHKYGVEHFVCSNRDDRGGDSHCDRDTPVNHGMLLNAQALINMARKRLCSKAHPKTIEVMQAICKAVNEVDPVLVHYLVPECDYRGGICYEMKPCGRCG